MLYDPNKVFREVTQRVCGNLDIDVAFRDTRPYLATLMPADSFQLVEFEATTGLIRSIASAVAEEFQDREMFRHVRLSLPHELFRGTIDQADARSEIINSVAEVPGVAMLFDHYGFDPDMSFVRIPLQRSSTRSAMIVVMAAGTNRFSAEHAELLELLRVPFSIALSNALRYEEVVRLRDRLEDDNRALHRELRRDRDTVVGANHGLRHVMDLVEQVAPLDSPVLLLGETGVGKEIVANAVHRQSPRRDRPMVRVNCGAMPETLIDSELFGHEKGAFTGAVQTKRGFFERADSGTVFLDEIGELPLAAQVKILRVLQSMELERVGGVQTIRVNVRVIAATHRDLTRMVAAGQFREDLWYRLNVFPVRIPPLRERRVDIPDLAAHFMESRARDLNLLRRPILAPEAIEQLVRYDWPGNVRELCNVVERALILSRGAPLSFPNLGLEQDRSTRPRVGSGTVSTLDEVVADHIRQVLSVTGGRLKGPKGAARLLHLHPSTLRNKMLRLGLISRGTEEPEPDLQP
jgi:transcriptional regulator with GAF, ATPase, and Fis domain